MAKGLGDFAFSIFLSHFYFFFDLFIYYNEPPKKQKWFMDI